MCRHYLDCRRLCHGFDADLVPNYGCVVQNYLPMRDRKTDFFGHVDAGPQATFSIQLRDAVRTIVGEIPRVHMRITNDRRIIA